ncbi:MAG TPA: lasso peptide biosynthesis B2 protein [Steroidobacteraceae bacterium]|jgi:hypothetical protein|nr:lasso peptide biosynthesis B2 protein [Steroidobacteraceae bacterium]
MNIPTYYLRNHTFACLCDRHYVILDLLADMYLRVEKRNFEALVHCTNVWSLSSTYPHESRNGTLTDESRTLLSELIARGLLTENPDHANGTPEISVSIPVQTLMSDVERIDLNHCVRRVFSFLASAAIAAVWLKQPISQTVSWVIERKRRRKHAPAQFNVDLARDLIAIFCRLRPFYNRRYLCLFDSLALLNFLARYDIFPTWVFGVQSEPFAAHCWVQHDEFVLNDTVDRVRLYTPLMAV